MRDSKENSIKTFDLSKSELNPIKFMGIRGKYYNPNLFYNTLIYDQIKHSIKNEIITFIIGNPLSGKTRIIFDSLKELSSGYIIIPKKDTSFDEYLIPKADNRIIYIDDIDDYCRHNSVALNKLLKYAIIKNIKLLITCRSGPEFLIVRNTLNRFIFSELLQNRFHIPRFDKNSDTMSKFMTENDIKTDSIMSFDGNLGSLILPLTAMRKRYMELDNMENRIPTTILKGLKFHFHLKNYEEDKTHYDDSKIRLFCNKYLQDELTFDEWESGKQILLSTDSDMNFLEEEDSLIIEEAYLGFSKDLNQNSSDVIDQNLTLSKIKRLYRDLYKDPFEAKAYGFPATIWDYNNIIKKSKSFEEAFTHYSEIPNHITLKPQLYKSLFKFTYSKETFIKVYKEMKSKKIDTKEISFAQFAKYFDKFSDLLFATINLDKERLKRLNQFTYQLIFLAKKEPKDSLKTLFTVFSPTEIHNGEAFNKLVVDCSVDDEDFNLYYEKYVTLLDSLPYPRLKNFVQGCIKLGKYELSRTLMEKHFDKDSFDYKNELANCYKESNPQLAYTNYNEAHELASDLHQELKTLTNINHLIYNASLLENRDAILTLSHSFLKKILDSGFHSMNLKYLKESVIKNEIDRCNKELLVEKVIDLIELPYLSKRTFKNLLITFEEGKRQLLTPILHPPDDKTDSINGTIEQE